MNRTSMIKAAAFLVVGLTASGLAACSSSSGTTGQQLDNRVSGQIEKNALINQPAPVFQHSDIRAVATEVEAIQALGEQTTSFGISNNGNLIWTCPSLGEPVAADTQLTNPQTNYNSGYPNGGTSYPIPNMDPNEIYAGPTTGTYVVCVDAQGRPYTQYWEGYVDTVSGPATWDATAKVPLQVTGAPTMPVCKVTSAGTTHAATVCTKS